MSITVDKKISLFKYFVWSSLAFFFLYQYLLRVSPSVMVNELRAEFSLSAQQFSYFGAFYLYAYSLLQIPMGIFVDKIGIKITVIFSIILCLLGTYLLANTHDVYLAYLSRILVGTGSACAFMCTLKVVADFFPDGKRGMLMGATLTLGVAGALVASKPLAVATDIFGWRQSIMITLYLGFFILFFVFLAVPNNKKIPLKSNPENQKLIRSIIDILSVKPILMYAILAVGLYTPLSVIADLWGVAYLMAKYGIEKTQASEIVMMMYIGLGFGSLVLPWFSEKYKLLNFTIKTCIYSIFVIFVFAILTPNLTIDILKISFFLLGFFCGAEMLCFVGVVLYSPIDKTGTTIGITNTANMLGGAIAQQIIGYILDQFLWKGNLDANGNRFYSDTDYTIALSFLILVIFLCCLIVNFLPKQHIAKIKAKSS